MALSIAAFVVFLANVVLGSSGAKPFFGDVGEMMTLFIAAICFVAAILQREAAVKSTENQES